MIWQGSSASSRNWERLDNQTMLTLAIETSGTGGSVALAQGNRLVAELLLSVRETHSRRLMPSISYLLERTGVRREELECIAVGLGPGSFTGLRIGLSTAIGLSMGLEIPVAGVPTFDMLAAGIPPLPGVVFCPVTDARKLHVYTAAYSCSGGSAAWHRRTQFLVLPPEELPGVLHENHILSRDSAPDVPATVLLAGDAIPERGEAILEAFAAGFPGVTVVMAPEHLWIPRAASAAVMARRYLDKSVGVEGLGPIYVRRSEAEEKKYGSVASGAGFGAAGT